MLLRLTTLTPREWALLFEATFALAVAALKVAVLPFSRIAAAAGGRIAQPRMNDEELSLHVAGIRWAVTACARRLPWRTKCFEQGLAAHWMLTRRRYGATLHYGVRQRPQGGLEAHVWVRSAGIDVVGCETSSTFRLLATFGA
jgi:hypothetical protein